MPALLALALLIRRRLPSIWSVLIVLAVLAAAAVVVLHSIAAWITGHPLTITLAAITAVTVAAAASAIRSAAQSTRSAERVRRMR